MKRLLASLFGGALTLLSATAMAQGPSGFGTQGQFVLGVDKLFGVNFYNGHLDPGGGGLETDQSRTQFNLLWSNSFVGGSAVVNPYSVPRFTFDYVIVDNVTLGGSLGYASVAGENDIDAPGVDNDFDTFSVFAFHPRVGYVLRFTDTIGMWLRGGLTYYSVSQDNAATASGFGINLEPGFIFTVSPGIGITATPSLDLPVSGSLDPEVGDDSDYTIRNFGANAGLFVYF